ncbi:MAG TPA: hypothetical protein DEB40_08370 [Elusimicrobia bacterium]|nr:hypothetical protein [Elusimicrobiota bacterium]HBT61743.1 hypothetical protein [Elusimicrobiota bacterium]
MRRHFFGNCQLSLTKRELRHRVERPLDMLFCARSHVAVLRILCYRTKGVSRRAASRATGLSHQACADAFRRLDAVGVLRRVRPGRRAALDLEHPLVKDGLLPLFALEERLHAQERASRRSRDRLFLRRADDF